MGVRNAKPSQQILITFSRDVPRGLCKCSDVLECLNMQLAEACSSKSNSSETIGLRRLNTDLPDTSSLCQPQATSALKNFCKSIPMRLCQVHPVAERLVLERMIGHNHSEILDFLGNGHLLLCKEIETEGPAVPILALHFVLP